MWQEDLARELTAAQHRERKTILEQYRNMTGHSNQHLYRIAAEHGYDSGKKTRSDKGELGCLLTDEQIEYIASLMYVTGRENKGPIMPVERAMQIAAQNGIIEPFQVTPSTMNRILRERLISKRHQKASTPYTEMRSLHPNHTHLFDSSVCIQYYLKNGKLGMMDERDFYKNKPDNFKKIKERLLRYVLVDHFSGAYYFRYYNTTGETQANLFDFLTEAWAQKKNDKFPFRGVPFNMLMDTGAANTSRAIITFLDALDVNVPKGLPYNPRRQGAVEVTHDIIEEWFESGLRLQPATSVEEMNAWAFDFMIWHQAAKEHTRHGMTRTGCWMLVNTASGELRELPEMDMLRDVFAYPDETRQVSGKYTISFKGGEYQLKHIPDLFSGAEVKVIKKPLKWPRIDVAYREALYECTPIEILPAHMGAFSANAAIIGRDYRAQPETATQQAIKRFDNMAYGEEKKKDAVPFRGLHVYGGLADTVDISYITKKGTLMEIERPNGETRISFTEFLKQLRGRVGTITKEQNQMLRAELGESVEVSRAEEIIREMEENHPRLSAAPGNIAVGGDWR